MAVSKEDTCFVAEHTQMGDNVKLNGFCNIYAKIIGHDCLIGPFVEIQGEVSIGSHCKISSHSFICDGVTIGDRCFVGHGVMFTNDRYPQATNSKGELKGKEDWSMEKTLVGSGVSIGSGVVILPGLKIGDDAVIGAGAVVTKDVAPGEVVVGMPARMIRNVEFY